MEKDKVNLASLARKFIGDISELGNEVVDNLIEPITENTNNKKIKIRDYPRNTYQPVISSVNDKRMITLYLPGVGSGDIEMVFRQNRHPLSGTIKGTFLAGYKIIATIFKYA